MKHPPNRDIRTTGLVSGYGTKVVVRESNLRFPAETITCILGTSGCGKSTLLRTLLLLEPPIQGDVWFGGVRINGLPKRELIAFRPRIGVLFQGSALFNSLSLIENVAFPLIERTSLRRELCLDLALRKLSLLDLDRHAHKLPGEVSGGMRKRCGIARALALDPEWLILDEPGAGLDPLTSAELDQMILGLRDTLGMTIIMVTHELLAVRAVADRVVMLHGGQVQADGTLSEILESRDPVVRSFFDRKAVPPAGEPGPGDLESHLLPLEATPGVRGNPNGG